MNPSAAVFTENPLLAVITVIEIYLLTVDTKRLLLVLNKTLFAQCLGAEKVSFVLVRF
jgi:hypothetical protein